MDTVLNGRKVNFGLQISNPKLGASPEEPPHLIEMRKGTFLEFGIDTNPNGICSIALIEEEETGLVRVVPISRFEFAKEKKSLRNK